MDMLTISHLAKRFGGKQVLADVSLSVPENTVFGFVGQNGAGKTTVMKLILGLLASDGGEISVNGVKVCYGKAAANRYVGYLLDVPEFYPYMTPKEYLCFCGGIAHMTAKESRERSEELLRLVGLGQENRRIQGFSRGMKQRLGLAQALLGRPKLLICDEPTSALDPVGRKELLELLVSVKEQATVIFSTHILSDVEHICDEVALLHGGRIVLQGSLEEVRARRKACATKLELEWPKDAQRLRSDFPCLKPIGPSSLLLEETGHLPDVLRILADKRMPVLRIERQEASLEDLFLEVVGK